MPTLGDLLPFAGALVTSLAATRAVLRLAPRLGLVDVPNERSMHPSVRPRGGGLGIIAGVLVAAALGALSRSEGPAMWVVLLGAVLLAGIGLADDRRPLPAAPRLLAELVVGAAMGALAGGLPGVALGGFAVTLGIGGVLVLALAVAAIANFYNFMDGIDGLAGGQAAAAGTMLVISGWSPAAMTLGSGLIAAALGFLVWNRPPARIFMGDSGSLFIGGLLAASVLLAPVADRPRALLAVAVSLSLFLLDPIDTLVRRWRGGRRIGAAHREHAYQRLAFVYGHARVSLTLVAAAVMCSVAAGLAYRRPALFVLVVPAACVLYMVERGLAGRAAAR